MKFRPLHDWVVIKRSKPVELTASGIIIPDIAKDKPSEGTVSDVGPGRYKQEKGKKGEKEKKEKKFFPTVLKPGQKVMFVDYMAKDVELDGTEITLIREDDVLGIMEQGGELAVKNEYRIEIKKELPPMVQTKQSKAGVAAGVKQTAKAKKEKQTKKAAAKKPAKKAPAAKKAAAVKKTAAVKAAKKTVGKQAAPKKAARKGPAKKAAPGKTVKKGPASKTAPKKTAKRVAAKKAASKKTAKKTKK